MKHALRFTTLVLILALAAAVGGCASYRVLQIEPVGKSEAVISPRFDSSYYYYDRDQVLHFIMRSRTIDKATGKPVEQIATVRVFWRPIGGKTSMEKTSLNATYRYVLITPDSVGMYEGAGFVRLWGKNGRKKLSARLMDGDLRLTECSANFVDTLGRAHIRGNFTAKYDDVKALDMLLGAQREFFARSLLSKPADAAATRPGEKREEDWTGNGEPATTSPSGAAVIPPTTAPANSENSTEPPRHQDTKK